MKAAQVSVATIELTCPHCAATIPAPNGSEYVAEYELETMPVALTCHECGEQVKKPAWPSRKGRVNATQNR